MMDPRTPVFDAVRAGMGAIRPAWMPIIHGALDEIGFPRLPPEPEVPPLANTLSERIMLEIIEHEGIVCEWYKDSQGVGTWGIGVTDKSGHRVGRYKDSPSTILRCLEVYEWLLRTRYLPEVIRALGNFPLTEAQLGGALSFHWNTGGILEAEWVRSVREGNMDAARLQIMNWSKPKEIISRRQAERNLFFDGAWTSDGIVTVYDVVNKPSYTPRWSSARQVDIRPLLRDVVARAAL